MTISTAKPEKLTKVVTARFSETEYDLITDLLTSIERRKADDSFRFCSFCCSGSVK